MQNRAANTPYRQHQDSLEFTLLRAKVMAEEGDAQEALRRFSAFSRERPGDVGAGYGLVHASLRAGEAQQAAALFARLAGKLESPLLQTLGARIDEALGNSTAAIERLRQAQLRHTADKPLTYAYVESLLRARRVREALVQIQAGLLNWPEDARLLALLAEARFAVGQPMEGHLAMAESHLSNDLPSAAMEQLQLAQKASGGDFYTRSIVESRLRELRLREQKDTKR
jgi:predicted Zn-dependent protease